MRPIREQLDHVAAGPDHVAGLLHLRREGERLRAEVVEPEILVRFRVPSIVKYLRIRSIVNSITYCILCMRINFTREMWSNK